MDEKHDLWKKTVEQLDSVTDMLGHPIDAGIREAVVAFIVNGFPTDSSCEGHIEERYGKNVQLRPYVEVGIPGPEQRYVGELEIRERIAGRFGIATGELDENIDALRAFAAYVDEHDVPETPEYVEIRAKHRAMESTLGQLLEDFYHDRPTGEDLRLVLERIDAAGEFRVTTPVEHEGELSDERLEEARLQLKAEQGEMAAFTQFLKNRFFSS